MDILFSSDFMTQTRPRRVESSSDTCQLTSCILLLGRPYIRANRPPKAWLKSAPDVVNIIHDLPPSPVVPNLSPGLNPMSSSNWSKPSGRNCSAEYDSFSFYPNSYMSGDNLFTSQNADPTDYSLDVFAWLSHIHPMLAAQGQTYPLV